MPPVLLDPDGQTAARTRRRRSSGARTCRKTNTKACRLTWPWRLLSSLRCRMTPQDATRLPSVRAETSAGRYDAPIRACPAGARAFG